MSAQWPHECWACGWPMRLVEGVMLCDHCEATDDPVQETNDEKREGSGS